MCGRYVIISTPEAIRALFGYGEQPNFPPRYNVAPTQPIPVVRLHDGKRSFALMRWGLLPSWVKDPKTFPLLINARGESVLDKPAFRNAMRRRRCLIPTDGFYEWQALGKPARRSGRISCAPNAAPTAPRRRSPLPDCTRPGPGRTARSSIPPPSSPRRRTARSRPFTSACRCSLPPEAFDLWLDCANVEADVAAALIVPADEALLEVYEVSTAVNRVANDSAALIAPVPAECGASGDEPTRCEREKSKAEKPKPSDDQASLF